MSTSTKSKQWFSDPNGLRALTLTAIAIGVVLLILIIVLFALVGSGWHKNQTALPPPLPPLTQEYYWEISPYTWVNWGPNVVGPINVKDVIPSSCLNVAGTQCSAICVLQYVQQQGGIYCLMPVANLTEFYYATDGSAINYSAQVDNLQWTTYILTPIFFETQSLTSSNNNNKNKLLDSESNKQKTKTKKN